MEEELPVGFTLIRDVVEATAIAAMRAFRHAVVEFMPHFLQGPELGVILGTIVHEDSGSFISIVSPSPHGVDDKGGDGVRHVWLAVFSELAGMRCVRKGVGPSDAYQFGQRMAIRGVDYFLDQGEIGLMRSE
jgi:hypothetical protein